MGDDGDPPGADHAAGMRTTDDSSPSTPWPPLSWVAASSAPRRGRAARRRPADLLDRDPVDLAHSFTSRSTSEPSGSSTTSSSTAWPPSLEDVDADHVAATAPMRLATWPSAPGRSGARCDHERFHAGAR
jgi:hypothetical protein